MAFDFFQVLDVIPRDLTIGVFYAGVGTGVEQDLQGLNSSAYVALVALRVYRLVQGSPALTVPCVDISASCNQSRSP